MARSHKDKSIQAKAKEDHASKAQRCSDDCEMVRVARKGGVGSPVIVGVHRLLRLTVPHLSYAVQDHAKRDEKSILIACNDGRNSHGNPRQHKRNSPLRVIAQIFGVHWKQPPFAEIKVRFHLQQDGTFWQETALPKGWMTVERLPDAL